MPTDVRCPACHYADTLVSYPTYKHLWQACLQCGTWIRQERVRYPAEWLGGLRGLRFLGRKGKSGVEVFSLYEGVLQAYRDSGTRDRWVGEFAALREQLAEMGQPLVAGQRLLDVSGEPGFLAADAKIAGIEVDVTAFSPTVAEAITQTLGVRCVPFDFANDRLQTVGSSYDGLLARYCMGYCVDLPGFARQAAEVLSPGGFVYISVSPPSHGMPLRWMFEEYTYKRAYTADHLVRVMASAGFTEVGVRDLKSCAWDEDLVRRVKAVSWWYRTREGFRHLPPYAYQQHNIALLFRKVRQDA